MSTINELLESSNGAISRGYINTNFQNLNNDKAETSALSGYLNKSTDNLDNISAGTTNKHFTATDKSKLDGIETGATANSADATLLARANHTGTQSADTITDGTTNKAYTATEKTKLSGIETGADVTDAANVAAAGAAMSGGAFHDGFSDFVANEHIDWTADQGVTNVHSGNIPDLSATYAAAAKGVTNGDSHDHNGGDGAQINHTTLSNIGSNTHAQIDTHLGSTSNPHSVTASQAGAVATSGNETIAGVKTFSSSPIVPTPTTDMQAATKKYVDDNSGGAPEGTAIKSTGETGGNKYLREDGDGTCSWQTVAGGGDVTKSGTAAGNQLAIWVNDGAIKGVSTLVYDATQRELTIGEEGEVSLVGAPNATAEDEDGGDFVIYSGDGNGTGGGGDLEFYAGTGGATADGGNINFLGGQGGSTSGDGGDLEFRAGYPQGGNSNGGDIIFVLPAKSGSGTNGQLKILPTTESAFGILDFESVATTSKTFTFPNTTGNVVVLSTGTTGVLRADSGVVSVDTDVTDIVSAASDTVAGKVELATIAETTAGTDTGRAITPDGLAGSTIFGQKTVQIMVFEQATDWAIGDGKAYFVVPQSMNGMNIVRVHARVITAGTTGTSDIQIRNVTDSQDILSTKLTIDSAETGSDTAATAAVINTSYDDLATNDLIAIDIDATSTTKPKGLILTIEAMLS